VTRRGAGKVKFGQPETESETEDAEPSGHAVEKPTKKKKHGRKKRFEQKQECCNRTTCIRYLRRKITVLSCY
jgi:hypothetical protein